MVSARSHFGPFFPCPDAYLKLPRAWLTTFDLRTSIVRGVLSPDLACAEVDCDIVFEYENKIVDRLSGKLLGFLRVWLHLRVNPSGGEATHKKALVLSPRKETTLILPAEG